MITKAIALGVLLVGWAVTGAEQSAPGATSFSSSLQSEQGVLDLSYKGRRILRYAFATNQFKPYVRELYTLRGDNILMDAPPDHLHHHGLMYAIRVNGLNFWEERDQPGLERPVRLLEPTIGKSASGLPQASFTQLIHWVANENKAVTDTTPVALLVETRTLTVTVDEARQEVALQWHADFQVGRGASKVSLAGANYHGLGLRLPESFNKVAYHENSELAPPKIAGGEVTPARWSSVSGKMSDHAITAALFGRADTQRGLPSFFTMTQPFTYLSVTQGLDKAPLDYSAGQSFSLEYLLVVYSERQSPSALQQRYERWVQ